MSTQHTSREEFERQQRIRIYNHQTDLPSLKREARTMTQHTPGPWNNAMGLISDSDGYCTDCTGAIAIVKDPTVHNATFGGLKHPMSIHTTEEMAKANARLIAAAPDLLAALKEATEALAHVSWSNVPYDPSNEQCKRAYRRGLNAIAKAEEGS